MKILHLIPINLSRHYVLMIVGLFLASLMNRAASKRPITFCRSIRFMLLLFLGLAPLGAQTPAPAPAPAPAASTDAPAPATPTSTPAPVAAVPPAAKAAAPRSVWEGVYSAEQVSRGEKAYNSQCARCHGENLLGGEDAPALVEEDFLDKWKGKSVGSLIEQTRKTMPSDGPGKLSRQQCTDITAYLLSANGFPAGKSDLKPDPESLNPILIKPKNETPPETPPKAPPSPSATPVAPAT